MADTKISFSDVIKCSKRKLKKLDDLSPLINEIISKKHELESLGLKITYKDVSITEFDS